MARTTRKHQWTGSAAPATFDWIVERAQSERTVRLREIPIPAHLVLPTVRVVDWVSLLERWNDQLAVDTSKMRAIEVEDRFPLLSEFFDDQEFQEHLALLAKGGGGLAHWASRFPEARFFEGTLSTFARLAPSRFDWASHLRTDVKSLGNVESNVISDLSKLLRRKGLLFVRSGPRSRDEWIFCHALHERMQLRIIGCEELADGTHLVVSRRR
ncbi:hypothetical protein K2Y11_03300 [bacterium]|nr:hypothetical protein [bacterium]